VFLSRNDVGDLWGVDNLELVNATLLRQRY